MRVNPIVPRIQREVSVQITWHSWRVQEQVVQLRNPIISGNAFKRNGDPWINNCI